MAINDQLVSALINAGEDMPDQITRDIGGHNRKNQPYSTGYFHVLFGLPMGLFKDQADLAAKWLHSTCESFQSHAYTLTSVDVPGIGGTGSSFPVNGMTTREFTLNFREYQRSPVLTVVRTWASVFDPMTGLSVLGGDKFIPVNYKGWCAVLNMLPGRADGEKFTVADVNDAYFYEGVFPKTVPVDTVASNDISAGDTIQLSVTFSFDGHPLTSQSDPGLTETLVNAINKLEYFNKAGGMTYNRYFTQLGTVSAPFSGLNPETTSTRSEP